MVNVRLHELQLVRCRVDEEWIGDNLFDNRLCTGAKCPKEHGDLGKVKSTSVLLLSAAMRAREIESKRRKVGRFSG